MKLSDKQAIILFDILKATIETKGLIGVYYQDFRIRLVTDIINQQNSTLIDLDPVSKRSADKEPPFR